MMGQALRRAFGRIPSSVRTRPRTNSTPQDISSNLDHVPPFPLDGAVSVQNHLGVSSPEGNPEIKLSNVLEERDPEYDALLQKMVGTISSKPGGKREMGEASIVQKYRRPLPTARSSKEEHKSHDEKPAPSGTLTIAQVQEIILLKQGKSAGCKAPIDIQDMAKEFGVDATDLALIVRFLSLPTENEEKAENKSK